MNNSSQAPVFVSGAAARAVFKWEDGIQALQATYGRPISSEATPPRTIARADKAWLRTLPAIPPGGRYFGAKLMGTGAGFTSIEYVIVLFDRVTNRIAAFVDANEITAFRTASTSAAALDRLAPSGHARLAVLGSGLEASMHARAFSRVRPLTHVAVFSPTPERRGAFVKAFSQETGVPATAASSAQEAVDGADIVLAAARSRGELPILFGPWLGAQATVVSIGSTITLQRELDVSVVDRADVIVCDTLHEVLEETGDMIAARDAGISFRDKAVSLSELMSGACEQRLKAAQLRLFKSVGGGLQDVVIAELILTKALHAGLAIPLPMNFETKI